MKNSNRTISLTAILVVYFLTSFFRVSSNIVIPIFMKMLHLSSSIAGLLAGVFFIPYAVMQLLSAPLCKKIGPFKVLSVGLCICAVGSVLLAFAYNVIMIILGRFLMGLGLGPTFVSVLFFLTENYTVQEYAKISGFSIMINNLGASCASAPLQFLLGKFGMTKMFLFLTFILIVLAFILKSMSSKFAFTPSTEESVGIFNQIGESVRLTFVDKQLISAFFIFLAANSILCCFQGLWSTEWTKCAFESFESKAGFSASITGIGVMAGCFFSDYLKPKKMRRITFLSLLGFAIAIMTGFQILCRITGKNIYSAFIIDLIYGFVIGLSCVQVTAIVRDRSDSAHNSNIIGFFNGGSALSIQMTQWITGIMIDIFILKHTANVSYCITFGIFAVVILIFSFYAGLISSTEE